LTVCEPVSSEVMLVGEVAACGSCGRPSDVVSTTVPVSGGTFESLLRLARSCAGVLFGRSGDACAAGICVTATTPAVTTTAAPGTAQRARLDIFTGIASSPVLGLLVSPCEYHSRATLLWTG